MNLKEYLRSRNPDPETVRRIDFVEVTDALDRFRDFATNIIEVTPDRRVGYVGSATFAATRSGLPFDLFYFEENELEAIRPLKPVLSERGRFQHRGVPTSLRKHVLTRDGRRCTYCDRMEPLHVDHIIPNTLGGPESPWNLWPLCERCNYLKGIRLDPEGLELAIYSLRRIATDEWRSRAAATE